MNSKNPFGTAPTTTVDPFEDRQLYRGRERIEVNGLVAEVHMPQALSSRHDFGGEEIDQGLPPFAPRPSFNLADYNHRAELFPLDWARANQPGEVAVFTPVKLGHGMWLNFTGNSRHTHDVAVLISVQGVNALTGRKVDDGSLEKYTTPCPIHNVAFSSERFCASCGFKWPAQNYLSTTTGRTLWLDGFRAADGVTRQFVFKATEEGGGIAQQVIGDERTFNIGVAFYLSRQPKPRPADVYRDSSLEMLSWHAGGNTKSMEIGAGARIKQDVGIDRNSPEYWATSPAGVLYINYTDVQTTYAI